MDENRYRKRERLLHELREECGWEGAILIRIDGEDGASLLSSTADDASVITRALVAALGAALPDTLSTAYGAAGARNMDFVDRSD